MVTTPRPSSEQATNASAVAGALAGDAVSLQWEQSIQRLLADYWLRADDRDAQPPEELFTENCEFKLGNLTLRGQAAVAAFFRKRRIDQKAAARTTRHFSTNFRARKVDDSRVSVSTTVLAFAGFGEFPIETTLPSIADFEDVCVLQADGRWLFDSRTATSIFAGPQAPGFAQNASGTPTAKQGT